MFHPKVSIIIPVYNWSNYLSDAIDSAIAQTYDNCEVIIINDGSNDNGKTEEIAQSYWDKIKYFLQKNGGVSSALNLGIQKATGEYISWLSHDDMYFPEKIRVQVNILSLLDDKMSLIYSNYQRIDFNGNIIKSSVSENIPNHKMIFSFLIREHGINGCTTLISKKIFEEVGLFNLEYRTIQDYDMWFRILRKYMPFYIDQVLFTSREHPDQWIHTIGIKDETDLLNVWKREIQYYSIRELYWKSIYSRITFYKKYLFLYVQMMWVRPLILAIAKNNSFFFLRIVYGLLSRIGFKLNYIKK